VHKFRPGRRRVTWLRNLLPMLTPIAVNWLDFSDSQSDKRTTQPSAWPPGLFP
jgi:hypothetical protein